MGSGAPHGVQFSLHLHGVAAGQLKPAVPSHWNTALWQWTPLVSGVDRIKSTSICLIILVQILSFVGESQWISRLLSIAIAMKKANFVDPWHSTWDHTICVYTNVKIKNNISKYTYIYIYNLKQICAFVIYMCAYIIIYSDCKCTYTVCTSMILQVDIHGSSAASIFAHRGGPLQRMRRIRSRTWPAVLSYSGAPR